MLKELFRKSIHLCSALVPPLFEFSETLAAIFLLAAAALYTVSEFMRLRGKNFPVISAVTQIAERKRDENKFSLGPVTLVSGILLAEFLFQPEAARIAVYALAFGDGLASLAGKLIGRVSVPFLRGKTAAGCVACFAAVFCSSFAVCGRAFMALAIALVSMATEALPLKDFDNIVIPLSAGALAQAFALCIF